MNQQNITLINPTAELEAAFLEMAEEFFEAEEDFYKFAREGISAQIPGKYQ